MRPEIGTVINVMFSTTTTTTKKCVHVRDVTLAQHDDPFERIPKEHSNSLPRVSSRLSGEYSPLRIFIWQKPKFGPLLQRIGQPAFLKTKIWVS